MTREEFDALVADMFTTETTPAEAPVNTAEAMSSHNGGTDISEEDCGIPPSQRISTNVARFSGADWAELIRAFRISILGCGGIGSWTALSIARFRPLSMDIHDMDTVERVNMAGQLFGASHVGLYKPIAVANTLSLFADYYPNTYEQAVDAATVLAPITICGFDNMEARKVAFEKWVSMYGGNQNALFMDGRMSADTIQIYAITGDDAAAIEKYRAEALFSDSTADTTVCSLKQTTYVAMMMGGLMGNLLVAFTKSDLLGMPYLTEYDSTTMVFKSK